VRLLTSLKPYEKYQQALFNRKPNEATHPAILPTEFSQLKKLISLDISQNGISTIPSLCLTGLTQIKKLCIKNNNLTQLSTEICNLTSLEELDLSFNALTSLPPEIAGLRQLKALDLQGNLINELPAQLSAIPQLENLVVDSQGGRMRLLLLFFSFPPPTHTTPGLLLLRSSPWVHRAFWPTWDSC